MWDARKVQWLHERVGNSPHAWLAWADILSEAAKLIRKSAQRATLLERAKTAPTALNVCAVILGHAIECALKGLSLRGRKTIAGGVTQAAVDQAEYYDLRRLAQTVGVEADDKELEVLDRLSVFVRFGRSSTRRPSDQIRHGEVPARARFELGYLAPGDFSTAENVLNRLTTRLRMSVSTG